MSAVVEATLRLEIAQYQAALAKAHGEVQKFKTRVQKDGSGLGPALFGSISKIAAGGVIGQTVYSGLARANGLMEDFVRRGIGFNASLDNAAVGIANVLRKFDGLNEVAAKDEAGRVMRRIVEIEPQTAGSLQDLTLAYMQTLAAAKAVGITNEENVLLTSKFANALANAGLEIQQLGQEHRSILSGNITADSGLAKILGITNTDVASIKASGADMFDFLNHKLGEFGEAGDSASVAWSSFQSALDKAAGAFAAGIFTQGIAQAKELSAWLETNQDLFAALGSAAADGMGVATSALREALAVIREIKLWLDEPERVERLVQSIKDTQNPDVYVETTDGASAAPAPRQNHPSAEGHTGVTPPHRKVDVAAGGSIKDPFSAVVDAARRYDEAKRRLAEDQMTREERIADLRKRMAEVPPVDPFAPDNGAALEAETRKIEMQRELNRLLKEEAETRGIAIREAADRARDTAEKIKAQNEAQRSLREEIMLLQAKAAGDDALVEKMERELRIRERTRQIEQQAGVSGVQARAAAERMVALEDAANRKQEESRPSHAGGVRHSRMMGGGLDEFHRNQRRDGSAATAFNADSLSMRGGFHRAGPLSGPDIAITDRARRNADSADAHDRRPDGPLIELSRKMYELWQRNLD